MTKTKSKMAVAVVAWALAGLVAAAEEPARARAPKPEARKAGEPEKTAKPAEPQAGTKAVSPLVIAARNVPKPVGEVKVYTNDDLEKMFGPSRVEEAPAGDIEQQAAAAAAGTEPPPPGGMQQIEPAPDAVREVLDEERREQQNSERIAQAEAKLVAAQEAVSQLERDIQAMRNPYLPKPKAPEGTSEDEWAAMAVPARLANTEKRLEQARVNLGRAQAELEAARKTP
jgi:hypothetical protein